MALYSINQLGEHTLIGLWKIEENYEELIEQLFMFEQENFSNNTRNLHWVATRVLLQNLLMKLGINEKQILKKHNNGKPYLHNSSIDISLSHSGDFAAVMISSNRQIGIDIEIISEKITRLAHKFVNDFEFENINEEYKIEQLYFIWSAKESIFKFYGKGELDFKENMSLDLKYYSPKQDGLVPARLNKGEYSADLWIAYSMIENQYVLTWISDKG